MAAIRVLLGEDCAEGRAASICVEIKLLAEVVLDEAWKGHQCLLQVQESIFVGGGPEIFHSSIAFALARQVVERGSGVSEPRDVITKEIASAQVR